MAYVNSMGLADVLKKIDDSVLKIGEACPHTIVGEVAFLYDQPKTTSITATDTMETFLDYEDSVQMLIANCPNTMTNILSSPGGQMSQAS